MTSRSRVVLRLRLSRWSAVDSGGRRLHLIAQVEHDALRCLLADARHLPQLV